MLNLLFYLSLISLSLGQLTSLTKSQGLNIYIFDVVVGLFVVYGIIYFLIKGKLKFPKNLIFFLVFSFVAMVSLLPRFVDLQLESFAVSAFYLIRFLTYIFAGVVVHNMIKLELISIRKVLVAFVYSGLFVAILGFIQLIILPDFETLDPLLGWDPHKNRLASTFFDPNFVGGYFVLVLVVIMHMMFEKFKISRIFLFLSLLILFIALFLTFSRSAWLMSAVTIFIYGLFRSRKILFLALLVAFLAYFAVPRVQTRIAGATDPADSAHFRLISWENTLKISRDNLFLGVGFNAFRFSQIEYGLFDPGTLGGNAGAGSDSSFLLVLATTGILGFIVFVIAYFVPLIGAMSSNSKYKLLLLSSLGGIFVQSQFINAVFYPQILFLLTTFLVLDS